MATEERVSAPVVLQSAATATGGGTLLYVAGYEWVVLTVAGISGDTITIEGQLDDSNWEAMRVMAVDAVDSLAAIVANNTYFVRTGGQRVLRANISTYSAGTITVTATKSSVCPFPVGYGLTSAKYAKTITLTPVLTTAAYADLDSLGGEQTLTDAVRISGGGGIIETLIIADKSEQKTAMDIVFFNANPAGTYANNDAVDITDPDLLKIIGLIEVVESDYVKFTDNYVVSMGNIGLAFKAVGSAIIYALIVTRGTPTYAVGDLQFLVTILQD